MSYILWKYSQAESALSLYCLQMRIAFQTLTWPEIFHSLVWWKNSYILTLIHKLTSPEVGKLSHLTFYPETIFIINIDSTAGIFSSSAFGIGRNMRHCQHRLFLVTVKESMNWEPTHCVRLWGWLMLIWFFFNFNRLFVADFGIFNEFNISLCE